MTSCSLEAARWTPGSSGFSCESYRVNLPLHRRLAVSQLTTLKWSLEEAIDGFRRGGVPGIGVSLDRMKSRGIERSIDEVQQSGLLVSTLGWIGGFTGGRELSWQEAVREGKLAIWIAAQLRAQAVTVITGPRRTHIRSHARRIVIEALRELSVVAERSGVRLALQPMHPVCSDDWTFLHSLDDTLRMLDDVGSPWVGLAYSPYHLWRETDLLRRIPEVASRVASVHLSDWRRAPRDDNDRALPGDGVLPLCEHVSALEEAGYRGLYEFDPWSRDLWKRNHHGLIAECRRRFEQLSAM